MEKPNIPKFKGDVGVCCVSELLSSTSLNFDTDSERDTITILQASLEEKPLELIKEIGCDYTAPWETQDL